MNNTIQDIPEDEQYEDVFREKKFDTEFPRRKPYDTNTVYLPNQEEKTLSCIAHISSFAGSIIPFANIIVPLALWQTQKDKSDYIVMHSKEALNFQISITMMLIMCIPLCFILIGFLIMGGLLLFAAIVNIIAAIKAYEGQEYRYPMNFRLIK